MASPGTRADAEPEDLDVEEALALVREKPGPAHGGHDAHRGHDAHASHGPAGSHHRATPWPEART
ncbi:molybdenum cofactor biosynthesis protein, partial [Streptomyces coelicoflavus ZG0656]